MNKLFLFLIGSLLFIALVSSNMPNLNEVEEEIDNMPSSFIAEVNIYYTPSSDDFSEWSTGVSDGYELNTNQGWCIIPKNYRGFYEEVKCQGSGIHQGNVYTSDSIGKTEEDSTPINNEFSRGRTSLNTDPVVRTTIAVNTNPRHQCNIPLGAFVYLDFNSRDLSSWTGVYRAEDVGRTFNDGCKIDVYVGVGEEAYENAKNIAGQNVDVYILPSSFQDIRLINRNIPSIRGFIEADYVHTQSVNLTLFEEVNAFTRRVREDCLRASNKTDCINTQMDNYNTIKHCNDFLYVDQNNFNPFENELNLITAIKSLADCSSNTNCGCEMDVNKGGTYNFSNGSITFDSLTMETGIRITYDGRSEFQLIIDPSDPIQFNSTVNGLEVYGGIFEEEELCQPRLEHFFMCASYENSIINDSNPVKFTVII